MTAALIVLALVVAGLYAWHRKRQFDKKWNAMTPAEQQAYLDNLEDHAP